MKIIIGTLQKKFVNEFTYKDKEGKEVTGERVSYSISPISSNKYEYLTFTKEQIDSGMLDIFSKYEGKIIKVNFNDTIRAYIDKDGKAQAQKTLYVQSKPEEVSI